MNWLPRLSWTGWTGCSIDGEYDAHGRALTIEWLGLQIELSFGKVSR